MDITVSTPGKIILSGEHAVVYGYPALVAATNKRCELHYQGTAEPEWSADWLSQFASLKAFFAAWEARPTTQHLQLRSHVPVGRGMGSSAACSVAAAAVWQSLQGKTFSPEAINQLAYQLEVLQHGTPSGVDNTIATYGGALWFRKETPTFSIFRQVEMSSSLETLWLVDSGRPKESTKEMVTMVAEQRQQRRTHYDQLFRQMEEVTRSWLRWVLGEETDSVELLRTNHRLLVELGVVSPQTQSLIQAIEKSGGAAKITGAGGAKQGSGYLLVMHPDEAKLQSVLKPYARSGERLELGGEGVRIE